MAENIENLEFQEISEIPVTEDKDGFVAIGVDSSGEAKAYPLDNFKTSDETDDALQDKANLKDLQSAQNDINSLKSTKADKSETTAMRSDIVNIQDNKLDKSELSNLQIAIKRYKADVNNISDLPSTGNEEGDGRKVVNDKDSYGNSFIWVWDGTAWSRTAFTSFPSDVALKGGTNKTLQEVYIETQKPIKALDIEESVSPTEKAVEYTYQNKYIDAAGNLNTYNGYWVRVYKVNLGDKIQIRGASSSTGKFYVLLSAYTTDNYTKVSDGTASTSGQPIDETVTIPAGVNYIAVTRQAMAYDIISESNIINDLEAKVAEIPQKADSGGSVKTLQIVDYNLQSLAENIGFEEYDQVSSSEKTIEYTYTDKFINTGGNLQTFANYWVRVYKVNLGDKIQIKGTASSTGKFYVLLSAYTEDNYTKVSNGTASTGGQQIDETVVIPEGVNYIAVTRQAMAYDIIHIKHSAINDLEEKVVNCDGDSLTNGAGGSGTTYPKVLQALLGNDWTVNNRGIGGENTVTIGARQGGMPMYIKNPITIPANGSTVIIPTEVVDEVTYYGLYSLYNDAQVRPLLQGGSVLINPCVIEGVACTLAWNGNNYTIKRNIAGSRDMVTPANCLITTSSAANKRGVNILFMGQNGGYDTGAELTAQFEQLADFKGDGKYIIITSHSNGYPNIVSVVKKRFGVRHMGLKEYCSTKAIYDAIDLGLLDSATYPTQADLDAMNAGNCPPSLLADAIHFNKNGYIVLGVIAYNKMVALGYVDNPKTFEEIKEIVSKL